MNHDHLQTNLAAIQPLTPDVARLVANTAVPPDWQPRTGSDGTPTYARTLGTGDTETIEWLGATSMPPHSAPGIIHAFDPRQNGANGMGAGIGTGYEWAAFARRLARHQALYVLETDPVALRLALTICDLAEPLSTGKILLLAHTDPAALETQLNALLTAHPGLNPPVVIHPLPTLPTPRRNAMITLAERLVRAAVERRAIEVAHASAALPALTPDPHALLALTLTPNHPFDRTTPALAQAAAAHRSVRTLALDHHTTAGPLAAIAALQSHRPAAILTDLFRPQLDIPLPAATAVLTVVPPDPAPSYWQPDRLPSPAALAPQDRILCHSPFHAQLLTTAGIPAASILTVPLAITPTDATPLPLGTRVALLADLPPADAESCGLKLPSHQALWQALTDLIAEDPFHAHPATIPDLLRRAQARSGVSITDPNLLSSLHRGTRDILLPTVTRHALARTLHAANIPLKLLGTGWQLLPLLPNATIVPLTDPAAFEDIALLLAHDPAGLLHPAILHAAQRGIPLAAPNTPHNPLTAHLHPATHYANPTPAQLIQTLRILLADPARRTTLAQSTRTHLQTHHTWPHRAAALFAGK